MGKGSMVPNRRLNGLIFLTEKTGFVATYTVKKLPSNLRLTAIVPALFSKVRLSEVFCGSPQIYGACCWESSSFEGATSIKRASTFLRKKCTLAASVPPPQCKIPDTRLV